MADREARINQSLKHLVDEFRMGMVGVDEYRTRRRALLTSWYERDVTTAPKERKAVTTATQPAPPRPPNSPGSPKKSAKPLLAVTVALVLGGLVWAFLPGQASTSDARLDALRTVKHAADAFTASNRWDEGEIREFLALWNALPAEVKSQARREPAVNTLRYELEQNLRLAQQNQDLAMSARLGAFSEQLERATP